MVICFADHPSESGGDTPTRPGAPPRPTRLCEFVPSSGRDRHHLNKRRGDEADTRLCRPALEEACGYPRPGYSCEVPETFVIHKCIPRRWARDMQRHSPSGFFGITRALLRTAGVFGVMAYSVRAAALANCRASWLSARVPAECF